MKAAKKEYKLFKKIKEDKIEVDQLHHYDLNLLLGNRDLQIAVIDKRDNRCLIVEDFIISSIDSYSKLVDIFEHIFDDHHLLKAGFWSSVKVGIKGNKFALVPESLFNPLLSRSEGEVMLKRGLQNSFQSQSLPRAHDLSRDRVKPRQ